jgi:hypothetical protein
MTGLTRAAAALAATIGCAAALAGCGGSTRTQAATQAPAATHASTSTTPPAAGALAAAEHPIAAEFPRVSGRSLRQLALTIAGTAQLGAATQTYTPGVQRFAFALTSHSNQYIYAPTAVYIASSLTGPVRGPFLAPADSVAVAPQFRSRQYEGPGDLAAVYWTDLPVPRSGVYDVLALTRVGHRLIGSTAEVAVALTTPIPGPGQRPPDVATDTPASVHGKVSLLTTRLPPESMHSVSFNHVLGRRPVALLFSTPQLCTSRVCGPVTDEIVELQHTFGHRIVFIHEEVYVNNQPQRGLRPQLKAFHLETEPWLFTVNRKGIITARLQGVFGINEARAALEAALR